MKFRVIKSSLDGISGGSSTMSIAEVCREISYFKGWKSLNELHTSIRRWAKKAKPGDVYTTAASCIVAAGAHGSPPDECPKCGCDDPTHLEYEELSPVEGGNIEQKVTCLECGARWMDVFVLAEQHELVRE
jgi:hypothetical protein